MIAEGLSIQGIHVRRAHKDTVYPQLKSGQRKNWVSNNGRGRSRRELVSDGGENSQWLHVCYVSTRLLGVAIFEVPVGTLEVSGGLQLWPSGYLRKYSTRMNSCGCREGPIENANMLGPQFCAPSLHLSETEVVKGLSFCFDILKP